LGGEVEIRNTVFQLDGYAIPFSRRLSKKVMLNQTPVITVASKAFFDVGHSLKDQRLNRRSYFPGYAAWEIHLVMRLQVQ